ncbi:DNA methyltransferase [Mesorhizobium sp. WSM4976]|uniref:DNA-methyltransferase n=1 Tax=Mesorhizobium sp. WSM4976 TaxID=3038549 RepID=UPI002417BC13|nr:DNA methyltransferase [Mesorhizobium sp. WSM4976]MDG4895577.1 DNA methyltransferase [Mesorhizobium sp. WSM4976]
MIEREEIIGDCRLLLENCLTIFPSLTTFDAVVSDPPYGIGFSHGAGGDGIGNGKYASKFNGVTIRGDDAQFDPSPWLAAARTVVLFGANHFADRLPSSPKWLVWDKRRGLTRNDFADCEMAWTNQKGFARLINHYWNGMMRDSERGVPRVHPTQKPIAVMEWVLQETTKPGESVLDPYMGSGSTGIACLKLGRKFTGIEIDAGYFEIACDRIRKAHAPPDMFADRPPEPRQETLL